jgi:hypothetical protein
MMDGGDMLYFKMIIATMKDLHSFTMLLLERAATPPIALRDSRHISDVRQFSIGGQIPEIFLRYFESWVFF